MAVGLRLGLPLCAPHICGCGSAVDTRGLHGLACRQSSGRMSRHHLINDIVHRALTRAEVPAIKEPAGLMRSDGKRPDGLTLIPWHCLTWDVTVIDTHADSYLSHTSTTQGSAAIIAANRKSEKYQSLIHTHEFCPIAIETLGPINAEARMFLSELGRRISAVSGEARETSFLMQRISVVMQRSNAVAVRGTFLHILAAGTSHVQS